VPKSPLSLSACWLALVLCAPVGAEEYSITEIPQTTLASGINRHGDVVGGTSTTRNLLYVHRSRVVNTLPLTDAAGINDRGQIAGTLFQPAPQAAVAYETGGLQLLGPSPLSMADGISNAGFVAGTVGDFHARSHAVAWRLQDPATTTELGSLVTDDPHMFIFDPESESNAVNDSGVVVGDSDVISFDSDGNPTGVGIHAFRWENGVMRDLGTFAGGDNFSRANAINRSGEVVGVSQTAAGSTHAFLIRGKRMLDLGDLARDPTLNSWASGIDADGEVVGQSDVRLPDHSVAGRAFIYRDGRMRSLTALIERRSPLSGTVTLTDAPAISCNGWIAANGFDNATLANHAYLLIPRDRDDGDRDDRNRDDRECRQR
jgi:probable HAF family extracellular repeat protein